MNVLLVPSTCEDQLNPKAPLTLSLSPSDGERVAKGWVRGWCRFYRKSYTFGVRLFPVYGAALLLLSACHKKVDVQRQAGELEKAFQTGTSSPFVGLAISAVRTNDYVVSVISLENARRLPGLTADQLMAVQRTLETITADLVVRADKGDARARAELAAIERSRSQ